MGRGGTAGRTAGGTACGTAAANVDKRSLGRKQRNACGFICHPINSFFPCPASVQPLLRGPPLSRVGTGPHPVSEGVKDGMGGWAVTAGGRAGGGHVTTHRLGPSARGHQLTYLLRLSAASLPRQICEKS